MSLDYFAIIGESMNAMIGAITNGAAAMAGSLAGAIVGSNVLPLMFGIQVSIAVVYFVLEWDGFKLITSVIKYAVVYGILLYILNSWPTIGIDFVNMVFGWIMGAIGAAAGAMGSTTIGVADSPPAMMVGVLADAQQILGSVTGEARRLAAASLAGTGAAELMQGAGASGGAAQQPTAPPGQANP